MLLMTLEAWPSSLKTTSPGPMRRHHPSQVVNTSSPVRSFFELPPPSSLCKAFPHHVGLGEKPYNTTNARGIAGTSLPQPE